ncbi:hypothetical protein FF38_04430 [Lucilia cuprina]|uniref:Uncharacterized protein n=1 Tax=Lucilia cuprina TaxID=7375 RepID=A0A0L0BN39_LUCCU|nr:hypothetical protein FF38_04430 [Lucilia cuprina]
MDDQNDDSLLQVLLKSFNLEEAYQYLKAAKVTYKSLKYIQKEEIKEAIPPLGLRIEFREKLFKWKKQQFEIDDETISVDSKVDNWMSDEGFSGKRVLNKCLIDILKETAGGRAILEYRTKKLTIDQRDFLIKIRVPDFPLLVNEIVSIFPSEKEVQGYYFISRGCKGSPSGKLYFKYKNCRRKRGIFVSSVSSQDEAENTSEHIDEEIDESVATAFKASLNRDSSDWADVCEKWKRTYKIRELQNLNNIDFLQSWSKLCHAKASDLKENISRKPLCNSNK